MKNLISLWQNNKDYRAISYGGDYFVPLDYHWWGALDVIHLKVAWISLNYYDELRVKLVNSLE